MKEYRAIVKESKIETHNVATIYLGVDNDGFQYNPGEAINIDANQFEKLKEVIQQKEKTTGKKEFPRGFSLSSSPHDKYISITVKIEPLAHGFEPILSPYLVKKLKPGDSIRFNGPYGAYRLPDNYKDVDAIAYINAGSGIAPSHGIWNFLLKDSPDIKQYLFYQLQKSEDIIYKKEINKLSEEKKLNTSIFLSREITGLPFCYNGYVNIEHIMDRMSNSKPVNSLFFICGPNRDTTDRKGFVRSYMDILVNNGIDKTNIICEIW